MNKKPTKKLVKKKTKKEDVVKDTKKKSVKKKTKKEDVVKDTKKKSVKKKTKKEDIVKDAKKKSVKKKTKKDDIVKDAKKKSVKKKTKKDADKGEQVEKVRKKSVKKKINKKEQSYNRTTYHSEGVVDVVFAKAKVVKDKDPEMYRKDPYGNIICRKNYNKNGKTGWMIDHIKPISKGGSDDILNLQAMKTSIVIEKDESCLKASRHSVRNK